MDAIEFRIRFDGNASGLAEHRLSIAEFGPAMVKLLAAVRLAAQEAAGGKANANQRYKASKIGKQFDLQLATITDGCVNLSFLIVPFAIGSGIDAVSDDFNRVAEKTAELVVRDLDAEWNSTSPTGNLAVRRFFESLPAGVQQQEYGAYSGGRLIRKTELVARESNDMARVEVPRLADIQGRIFGVRFDPPRIDIRDAAGAIHRCRSTSNLIQTALDLRENPVAAKVLVRRDGVRLLILRGAGARVFVPTANERRKHLYTKWDGTLRKLAE